MPIPGIWWRELRKKLLLITKGEADQQEIFQHTKSILFVNYWWYIQLKTELVLLLLLLRHFRGESWWIFGEIWFLLMWNSISSHVELKFFQFKVGFLAMWNWISSNVELDFFQSKVGFFCNVKLDFFQCEIWFLPSWNWISSNMNLYFFHFEIGFLPMWNWISSDV